MRSIWGSLRVNRQPRLSPDVRRPSLLGDRLGKGVSTLRAEHHLWNGLWSWRTGSLPLEPAKAVVLYFRFLVLYFIIEAKFTQPFLFWYKNNFYNYNKLLLVLLLLLVLKVRYFSMEKSKEKTLIVSSHRNDNYWHFGFFPCSLPHVCIYNAVILILNTQHSPFSHYILCVFPCHYIFLWIVLKNIVME